MYQNEVDDIASKHGGREHAKEAEMYHGTSLTPPASIYKSEEGFDMRYSKAGSWGHANYFAKNSYYSNAYAYTDIANGTKQMLCAQVLIGKTILLGRDKTLKRPPFIPDSTTPFDSVKGDTPSSEIIMVYSNKKAYPQYLITYK